MRRLVMLACLCLAAGSARAWEFTPNPVCTLHNDGPLSVRVTFDPRLDQPYAITLRSDAPWPVGALFGLSFEGPRGLTITTGRHRLSGDRLSLTVTDRGFGNVLNGLEFNTTATAFVGDTNRRFALDGAAEPVQAFRSCIAAPVA